MVNDAYSFNKLTTDIAVAESSPVVGSSRNTISGDIISSIPMLVRFLSPPETPLRTSVPTYIAVLYQHTKQHRVVNLAAIVN